VQLLSIKQGRDIRLAGELDMSSRPELDEVLLTAVEQGGPILVDLSELRFIDSTGISALMQAAVVLGDRGCLILHGEQDRVRRVLDLVGVEASIPNLHRIQHLPLGSSNGSEREHSQATERPLRRAPTSSHTLLPEPSGSTPHDVATASTRNRPLESELGLRGSASNGGPGSPTSAGT
jgi:anti-sigma B factor antagonist